MYWLSHLRVSKSHFKSTWLLILYPCNATIFYLLLPTRAAAGCLVAPLLARDTKTEGARSAKISQIESMNDTTKTTTNDINSGNSYFRPNLTGLLHGGKCYVSSHVAAGIVADSKRLTWPCDTIRNEKAAENRPSSSASQEGGHFSFVDTQIIDADRDARRQVLNRASISGSGAFPL
uniref:Uncharacterized protein n=1 Tax=Tanacetum cinerariifolium TaxID=118510 RepID=A0A699GPH1_TANCI|nr:hypothetical protein [Tanacetum cinerariifolium]